MKIPDRIPGPDKDTMDLTSFDSETVIELIDSPRDYYYKWNGKEHVRVE